MRGEGARLWDADGKEYLDFFAGLSVHNAGHCHPAIVAAIAEQAARLAGVSNLFYTEPAMRLADASPSRASAARSSCATPGPRRTSARSSSHASARTRAESTPRRSSCSTAPSTAARSRALAATPKLAREDLFGPLPAGFVAVPRDDPGALRAAVGERTAAVLVEPIQGEAGVFPIAEEVLVAAREACDEAGALLVFDEIQTGMGRTGTLWAYEQLPVRPDVLTAAKALGGGLPVGACVTARVRGRPRVGDHGSTFAGAPIAAAAALAALAVIDDPELLRRTASWAAVHGRPRPDGRGRRGPRPRV